MEKAKGEISQGERRNLSMFRIEDDEILDEDRLGRFLALHAAEATFRYKPLMDAYMTV